MRSRTVVALLASMLGAVVLSVASAVLAGLELLPTGRRTTSARLDLEGAHAYGASWLLTIDESSAAQTCRSTAVVSPNSYGVAGFGITLELDAPREISAGAMRLPVRMKPGADFDDIELDGVAQGVLDGSLGTGTLLIWPFEFRCGWPFRSMRYWLDGAYGWNRSGYAWDTPVVVGGIERSSGNAAGGVFTRAIPLEPLWPGMLGNTLVYGAAIFVTLRIVGGTRRAVRRRAGRCEACGHPLGGANACPECGAGYERRAVSAGAIVR